VYVIFHYEIEGGIKCQSEKKQYLSFHWLDKCVSEVSISEQAAHEVLFENIGYVNFRSAAEG